MDRGVFLLPKPKAFMTNQQFASAVQQFATDLDNSIMMEDRRESVVYLSNKIGSVNANKLADIFGLTEEYYKV
jgi:hypothetical protein